MANEKYGKYVHQLEWLDAVTMHPEKRKPGPYNTLPKPLRIDNKIMPVMTHWMDIFPITEPCGTGVDAGEGVHEIDWIKFGYDEEDAAMIAAGPKIPSPTHYHTVEEMFLFLGTDPKDPLDLGGELELWLGIGRQAEKFIITKSSLVVMPAGLAAHPMVFRKVDRLIWKIVIYEATYYTNIPVDAFPPDFKV